MSEIPPPVDSPGSSPARRLGSILTLIFCLAMLMGPGPGVLLVNSPEPLWGLPRIYAWGLVWYVVQVVVVVAAYLFVWRQDDSESSPTMR